MPSHLASFLGATRLPVGSLIESFASFEFEKWISSVFSRSKRTDSLEALLYRTWSSLSRTRIFFLKEEDTIVIEKSSIYDSCLILELLVKRSLTYIRKRIGEIGEPCGIPVLTVDSCGSVWLSKESLSFLSDRKDSTHLIKLLGSRSLISV